MLPGCGCHRRAESWHLENGSDVGLRCDSNVSTWVSAHVVRDGSNSRPGLVEHGLAVVDEVDLAMVGAEHLAC
jgi:hypothetical protein